MMGHVRGRAKPAIGSSHPLRHRGQRDPSKVPTTPTPPFRIGEKINDPVQMYLEDLFTVGANLAGIPALSMPVGTTSSGLPLGMQLQGAPLSESKLLRVANAYQREIEYRPRIALAI